MPAFDLTPLRNPVWTRCDQLRDPAILVRPEGYHLFYTRWSNGDSTKPENFAIGRVLTRDFRTFTDDGDVSPKGYASPGDPIFWHGRWVLPYQTYPIAPAILVFSESNDLQCWSKPRPFLEEANLLPWNTRRRVIDPTFVVDGDRLVCFFVGSCDLPAEVLNDPQRKVRHGNLIGYAVTRDPALQEWEILSVDQPLIGRSAAAPDGAENVVIIRPGAEWIMIYSEGLDNQHLAWASSPDLLHWTLQGPVTIPIQSWMSYKHGAPYIWREADTWMMILMGESHKYRTTFGLLTSPDGLHWTPLPEG